LIQIEHLVKAYTKHARPAVDDVSFNVEEGMFFTLLGPSGCGKTTILRSIAGLERPDSGTIRLGDTIVHQDRMSVPTHQRDIGMVFQNYAVWPHMDVFHNVAFPLTDGSSKKVPKAEVQRRVANALDVVGLSGLERRMSTQLSGGQQQRLSFARAIVREPAVLLLDEPLSNLDAKLRERMRRDLTILHTRLGITTLFVTHDQIEALSMSDRIGVMRDGKIIQEGPPEEIYHHPIDEFVATFIGTTNLVRGVACDRGSDWVEIDSPLGRLRGTPIGDVVVGADVTLAIRPEEIGVTAETPSTEHAPATLNRLHGRIVVGLFSGSFVEYEVDVGGTLMTARSGSRGRIAKDSKVHLDLPVTSCRVFPRLRAAEQEDAGSTPSPLHDH
jgi:iron(III) transport system ATP-binding protein